jgi:hypothetical protein
MIKAIPTTPSLELRLEPEPALASCPSIDGWPDDTPTKIDSEGKTLAERSTMPKTQTISCRLDGNTTEIIDQRGGGNRTLGLRRVVERYQHLIDKIKLPAAIYDQLGDLKERAKAHQYAAVVVPYIVWDLESSGGNDALLEQLRLLSPLQQIALTDAIERS